MKILHRVDLSLGKIEKMSFLNFLNFLALNSCLDGFEFFARKYKNIKNDNFFSILPKARSTLDTDVIIVSVYLIELKQMITVIIPLIYFPDTLYYCYWVVYRRP